MVLVLSFSQGSVKCGRMGGTVVFGRSRDLALA